MNLPLKWYKFFSISLNGVCNGRLDCTDGSDEIDCDKIHISKSYLKDVPPITVVTDEGKSKAGKVKLNISLTLESILDLDEVKSLMKLKIKLNVSWEDSRLKYIKMHPKKLNSITLSQKKSLWLPHLIFDNTNDVTQVSFDDDLSYGMIQLKPNAKHQKASLKSLHNFREFKGQDG